MTVNADQPDTQSTETSMKDTQMTATPMPDSDREALLSTVNDHLDALDVKPSIKLLVTEVITAANQVRLFDTKAKHYVALVPVAGAQIALYAQRNNIGIALTPEAATAYADGTGVKIHKKGQNGPTWYLEPTAQQLTSANTRAKMLQASLDALTGCIDTYVAAKSEGVSPRKPDPGVCVVCNLTLLPNGACGTEGCSE